MSCNWKKDCFENHVKNDCTIIWYICMFIISNICFCHHLEFGALFDFFLPIYIYIYIYILLIIISSKCSLFSLPWKIQFSTFINARYNIQCVHTFYKCGALRHFRQYFRTILKSNRNIVERCEIGTSSFWYGFNRVFIDFFLRPVPVFQYLWIVLLDCPIGFLYHLFTAKERE